MANTKSAEKAAKQAEQHRAHNVTLRSRMRTAIRKVNAALAANDKDGAKSTYQAAVPVIDTMVSKKIIHKNQANRHKSRLAAKVKALVLAK
ncbi:MAG: 30S ribosomal protein S20 [Steroidobacteraceae bacterium]